jgi:hypothetical protein
MMQRKTIAVLGASLAVCFLVAVTGCSSGTSGLTYDQFTKALDELHPKVDGVGAVGRGRVNKADFLKKFGQPQKMQVVDQDVYLYYSVKEGEVQIIIEKGSWETQPSFPVKNINLY